MTDRDPSDRLLRVALRMNAGFSGLCGVTALLAGATITASFGIEDARLLPATGASLVFFSGLLVFLVTRRAIKPAFAIGIVVIDILWVATTPVPLLLSGWLTALGTAVVLVLAGIVLSFAALQYAGVRQMKTQPG
jgi:hypothetical protein